MVYTDSYNIKIDSNCENCKHEAVCKWKSEAKRLNEDIRKSISEIASPLRINISCSYYEYEFKRASRGWASSFSNK